MFWKCEWLFWILLPGKRLPKAKLKRLLRTAELRDGAASGNTLY